MNISVIIPLYNGQKFIERAILSVFNQTKLPAELIVVDDASIDDSVKIVEAMLSTSPIPIKIIKLQKNSGGPARPLNVGVREAGGELISVLDQDDYFMPVKLERLHDLLIGNPDTRLAFSSLASNSVWVNNASAISQFREVMHSYSEHECACKIKSANAISYLLGFCNFVWSFSAFLFYREDWVLKCGFDEDFIVGTDYDFLCWVAARSDFMYTKAKLYFKEFGDENLSCQSMNVVYAEIAKIFFRYLNYLEFNKADCFSRDEVLTMILGHAWVLRRKKDFFTACRGYVVATRFIGMDAKLVIAMLKCFIFFILSPISGVVRRVKRVYSIKE